MSGLILLAGSSFLLYWSSSPLQMAVIYLSVYAGMMLSAVGMGAVIRWEGFRTGFFLNGAVGAMVLFRYLYHRHPAAG